MRPLLFIILAGYTVRCNDASYYVIEMPEETPREYTKPFRVYWNVPTMQCRSKKIPFTDLYEKFGIIQNSGDSFRGEKVSILYDPGLFPALLKNETSGKFKFRNGGVPQEGDLEKHLLAFRSALEQSVPDEDFGGIGIIDFESWRPVFRQNFGVLIPYKDISYQIERKLHWWWTERAIQARARQRFEEAGRAFMQTTLSIAKQLRPRALWGYYGFPYCFNMASNNMVESCSDKVKQENDMTHWLWSESTALYPSIYSSKDLSASQLAKLVRGRVTEAARVARRGTPVLPYFWFRYREGGFLSQTDLDTVLETLYKSNASGFIIWGSSNDVNTVDKCNSLLQYTEEVMGPAIAKYTKAYLKNSTDTTSTVSSFGLTTWRPILRDHIHNSTTTKPTLDPEYHWIPPVNYTQDIVNYVDQELKKKPGYNTSDKNTNETGQINLNKNLLLDMILNIFKNDKEVIKDTDVKEIVMNVGDENRPQNEDGTSTTVFNTKTNSEQNTESSTGTAPNIVTRNPLIALLKDTKKGIVDNKYAETDLHLHEASNNKFDYKITTTTSHTTLDDNYFTDKLNESSQYMTYNSNDSQENMTTSTELNNVTENEDIIDLEINISSVIIANLGNKTTSTEPNLVTESDDKKFYNISKIETDESNTTDSQENVTTSTDPNIVTQQYYDIIPENLTIEVNTFTTTIDHSTEVTNSSTFDYAINIAETNPTTSGYNNTNTRKDYTDSPLNKVEFISISNFGTLHDNLNKTTSHTEEKSSLDKPDKALDTFEATQKPKSSKNHKKGHVLQKSFTIITESEAVSETTESYTIETESSTSDYRDAVYDDTERFRTDYIESEEYFKLGVNTIDTLNKLNSTASKDEKKGVPLEKYNQSTNTEYSLSNVVEELHSTTENPELTESEVPDIETEGFRIDGVTEDLETTTNAREVVVFL